MNIYVNKDLDYCDPYYFEDLGIKRAKYSYNKMFPNCISLMDNFVILKFNIYIEQIM